MASNDSILGQWTAKLTPDESLPDFTIMYQFKPEGVLFVHADGTPPTPGAYMLESQSGGKSVVNMEVPVANIPLPMRAVIEIAEEQVGGQSKQVLLMKFTDSVDDYEVKKQGHSTPEQLELWKTDDEVLAPPELPPMSAEIAALTEQERKNRCIRHYLQKSMSTGMEALGSQTGLGAVFQNLIASGEAISPSIASKYFHSALQVGSQHAHVLYSYGYTADQIPAMLEEPATRQIVEETMMQQVAQMFGGDPNNLMQMLGQLQLGEGGEEGPDDASRAAFEAGMQAALANMAGGNEEAGFPGLGMGGSPFGAPPGGFPGLGMGGSPFGAPADGPGSFGGFGGFDPLGGGGSRFEEDPAGEGEGNNNNNQFPPGPPGGCAPQ